MPRRWVRFVAPDEEVAIGFEAIRSELSVPEAFPPEVEEEAAAPPRLPERDLTEVPFVTLDPAGSRDLDQAFHLERGPSGFLLRYAIADVASFVQPAGALDREVRRRGLTLYAPDRRTPLHPLQMSEGSASLLPDQDRPAVVWELRLGADGVIEETKVARALVRSREQLSYEQAQRDLDADVDHDQLRLLVEVGRLRKAREAARGGVSLEVPEQRVRRVDGGWGLELRAVAPVERWNAQLSLAAGIAAGRMMAQAGVGVLRTLPPAQREDVAGLRRVARALQVSWPDGMGYPEFIRSLDGADRSHTVLLAEASGVFRGAGYQVLGSRKPPRPHSAVASVYAHVTAPLRRLADRYAAETCLAVAAGADPPRWVLDGMPSLPDIMARSSGLASRYAQACLELVEAAVMVSRVGETFRSLVLEYDPGRAIGQVQLLDPAVKARVQGDGLETGEMVDVRVASASLRDRVVLFVPA